MFGSTPLGALRVGFEVAAIAACVTALRLGEHRRRNDAYMDIWSWGHFVLGVGMGWIMDPFLALVLLILWEPLEIFVLSPLMWRWFRIEFGYESLRNSLSDIVFDAAGVAAGAYALAALWDPPFTLFG